MIEPNDGMQTLETKFLSEMASQYTSSCQLKWDDEQCVRVPKHDEVMPNNVMSKPWTHKALNGVNHRLSLAKAHP